MGISSGLTYFAACMQVIRGSRYISLYRHAASLAMKLKLRGKDPERANYGQIVTLSEVLQLVDLVPDSFDTEATREIRQRVRKAFR